MQGCEVVRFTRTEVPRREEMRTPEDVSAMLALKALGWGAKRIAAELGCSRNTVRRWCSSWAAHAPSAARHDK
jgi:uncharacterized protein YjcR